MSESSYAEIGIGNITHEKAETHKGKVFTPDQREKLEQKGYKIFQLTGDTLREITDHTGKPIDHAQLSSEWQVKSSRLMNLRSLATQVAVQLVGDEPLPKFFSLPTEETLKNEGQKVFGSLLGVTPARQEELLAEYARQISTDYPGAKAIMGSPADYLDLIRQIIKQSENVFAGQRSFKGTLRTSFKVGPNREVHVSNNPMLRLDRWEVDSKPTETRILPLVIPDYPN